MDPTKNRVADGLNDWKAREARFEKIFTPAILKDSAFLKEKLTFYDHLQVKYGRSGTDEEKMMLRVLAQQRSELRRQLYPNILQRLFQRIIEPVRERQALQQSTQKTEQNLKELQSVIKSLGFEGASDKLAVQLGQGLKEFTIPVSNYVSENQKVQFDLSFSQQADGRYTLGEYRASLQKDNKPAETVTQVFKADARDAVTAQQAQNLLAGRAVMKDAFDSDGLLRSKWIQLDFNDREPGGNHKLKEFLPGYGFDLEKAAQQLIQKENLSVQTQKTILQAVQNGDRQPITLMQGNVAVNLYIEANPQFKTVNIYDESARKITMQQALGEKPVKEQLQKQAPKPELKTRESKKNSVGIR